MDSGTSWFVRRLRLLLQGKLSSQSSLDRTEMRRESVLECAGAEGFYHRSLTE